MSNTFQHLKSAMKRSWATPVLGIVASLAVAVSTLFPLQASAAEPDGPFVVIIGAPGSGKSTVGAYIAESTSIPVIEVGQLLRDEIAAASRSTAAGKPGSQRAKASAKRTKNVQAAKDQLEAGKLVDGQAIDAAIAVNVLAANASHGFVLDGYPGSAAQAEFLDALLVVRGTAPIVIYLDVSDEVALARIKSRGRVDDQHGFGKKRLSVFRDNIKPLLAYYEDAGLYTVDANKGVADVLAQVDKVLSADH
jgi:adenylate kinase